MALSAATIPEIVSSGILESLKEGLVYGNLFNRDYTGDVAPGNVVKIPSIGAVTVGTYSEYTDMVDQNAADSSQSMTIDQKKYFSIVLDDIDAAMAKPAILGAYAKEASFQIQKTIDSYLAGILAAGGTLVTGLGTSTTPIEVNSANIGSQLSAMAVLLDNALVPRSGRFVVLPPWAVEKLTIANIAKSTDNAATLAAGFVAQYAGFDVLMSPLVPNTTNAKYKIIAGSSISATMALAINKTEIIRHEAQFADKLRGLAVYGSKVTRAATICVGTWNNAAEA